MGLELIASETGRIPGTPAALKRIPLPGSMFVATCDRWLMRNSIHLLRTSMGAIILGFGFLKFFPGVSPAQNLVMTTTDILTLGLVPHHLALIMTATLECIIGLSLITTWWLRATVYLLAMWLVGILSPTVLLFGRLFGGPDHAPTLEGQYVLKDIILVTASLVIVATMRERCIVREMHKEKANQLVR